MVTFTEIAEICFNVVFIFGPCFAFVQQANKIKETRSSDGISTILPFMLIHSSMLRIFFWIGMRFETTFLFQCIAMLVVNFYLLFFQIKYSGKGNLCDIDYFDYTYFWKWTNFFDYVAFLVFTTVLVSFICHAVDLNNDTFVQALGFLSLGIEACFTLPQVFEIIKTKTVKNLSVTMIALFFLGDASKTVFFIIKESPIQFIVCGSFQLMVDCILVFLLRYYRKETQLRGKVIQKEFAEDMQI